jgi:dTDP-L-rhamnose 4-epimerase
VTGSVLITGGAGFIGSHLADHLLERGYRVRALDSLVDQVHDGVSRPGYLDDRVELAVGDVRDRDAVERALEGVDQVVHFAARVGVGQSMYEIADYTSVNCSGTAVLLEAMMDRPIQKLLVASSMSVYGEGAYLAGGRRVEAVERGRSELERREWEPRGVGGETLRAFAVGCWWAPSPAPTRRFSSPLPCSWSGGIGASMRAFST